MAPVILDREKVILTFYHNNLHHPDRKLLNLNQTHSLIYLLHREGEITFPRYYFVPRFGPYSFELQNDLDLLASLDILSTRIFSPISYTLTDKGEIITSHRLGEDEFFNRLYVDIAEKLDVIYEKYTLDQIVHNAYLLLSRDLAEYAGRFM